MFIERCLLAATALWIVSTAYAQDHPDDFFGRSFHGEVFNEGPRQKAYLMGKTGNVRFPITTRSAEAQKFFEQGVGQLHGFWYFEAERSFRQVALLDPDCAMAYWGMAMANHENAKRAAGFIKKARDRLVNTTRRERLYIESMCDLLLTTGGNKRQQVMDAFKKIWEENPGDIEAKAFYVVRGWQWSLGGQTAQRDKLLDEIFKANPLHPAHHYRIHLWDGANPSNALGSAALCGSAAPNIAHMWHMPGHTYDRLKRYAEAAWQQEASSRADHYHMMHDRVLPDQIHNYAHNQEWLIRSLSHSGRVKDAVALAKNLIELPRHPRYNTSAKGGKSASYGRTRLFELLERFELWDETLALADTMYLDPTELANEQVKRLRLIGLAHAGKGNKDKLAQTIDALQQGGGKGADKPTKPKAINNENERTLPSPSPLVGEGGGGGYVAWVSLATPLHVSPAANPKKPPEFKGKGKGPPGLDGIAARDNAVKELQMLQKLLADDPKSALDDIKALKNASQSRQARYYLLAGDKVKAEQFAKQASDSGKNQVAPLALYVECLHAVGKTKECADAFDRLRKISGTIDSLETPMFKRLTPIAKELKLPADWRVKTPFPADFGKRPPIESIGPLVWQPTPAPEWTLPDANGNAMSSKAYSGKPVLAIFYLGYGCSHCMEQLQKFGEQKKAFEAAGIAIVAISTDTTEALKAALSGGKTIPFPVASDAKHVAFQRFRAYDDFEGLPLHGTFLIDERGLVRWHDIGYDPFMDATFVLNEAKRLLAMR
ncbi:MAG: redoxin domain-containing protein [Planctomycetes bacterium]|nr:redoxin domain-containing protein [Planctomycetota bacterium]